MNELEKFLAEVNALVDTPKEVAKEYRVYYNNNGEIVGQSMTEPHLSGDYIVVQQDNYENIHKYARVKDGELKVKVFNPGYKRQLVQGRFSSGEESRRTIVRKRRNLQQHRIL